MTRIAINWSCAAAGAVSLMLSACVHSPDVFPAQWPGPRVGATCADIAGTYAERGNEYSAGESIRPGDKSWVPLSAYLFQTTPDRLKAQGADRIEIAKLGGDYRVRALRGIETLNTMRLAESALLCKDGWLTVSEESGLPKAGPVFGYSESAIMLHAAADGALIIRMPSSGTGLAFMIVPVSGSSVAYMRFEPRGAATQRP